jgi:sterol desaturase/sphingolipid hydroxylase (fatty acid hydroxylase superfamily)
MTDSRQPPPSAAKPATPKTETNWPSETQPHWLVRPTTIRGLWLIFIIILAGTVAAQFYVHVHSEFGIEGTLGFNAWYGFGACVALIVVAKILGVLIKRTDTDYGN